MFKKLTNLFKRTSEVLGVSPAPEFSHSLFVGVCKHETVEVNKPSFAGVDFYKLSFAKADDNYALGYRVHNNGRQLLVFDGKKVDVVGLGRRIPNNRVQDYIKSQFSKG